MLTHPLGLVAVAFAATAVPAFLSTKVIGKHLESVEIMGASLLIGGVAMWIVDGMSSANEARGPRGLPGTRIRTWGIDEMSPLQAV